MVGHRLRIKTEGLAKEDTSALIIVLRVIFSVVVFGAAAAGLVGIIIFSNVHWTSFS